MVKQTQINRGKKWVKVRDEAIFKNYGKDVDWLLTQKNIQEDIKAYEDSIKPEPIKSKDKK